MNVPHRTAHPTEGHTVIVQVQVTRRFQSLRSFRYAEVAIEVWKSQPCRKVQEWNVGGPSESIPTEALFDVIGHDSSPDRQGHYCSRYIA